ncbi:MAG: type II secretion system F family protein [Steroidobacteraceae bacterium]
MTLLGSSSLMWGVAIALVFGATILFALGVASFIGYWRYPLRRRLAGIEAEVAGATSGTGRRLVDVLGPLGRFMGSGSGKERSRLELLLHRAGFRSQAAATTFYGIKGVLGLALPSLWLVGARFLPQLSSRQVWFAAGIALFIGMVLPNKLLERRVAKRQRRLSNGFPDALDLLVICVESGLGLAAAIERVAGELRFSHPELATELALVNVQIRAGVDRETALRNLSERTGLADIRGLVSLLVQTLRFGTSVADTLRIYSDEFRDQRTQRAEEQAAKMGTKLIFPLILCMFPGFFVVAAAPAIIKLMAVL